MNDEQPAIDELKIAYQDEHYVLVDKPAGLLVHKSWIAKEAKQFALQMLRDQLGQWVFPIHRLDRPTSGLLMFALSKEAATKMSLEFQNSGVEKTYVALVRGVLVGRDTIDYPLVEILDKMTDSKAKSDKPAQNAVTRYQALGHYELPYSTGRYPSSRFSMMRFCPLTGRKHQLRRHMHHVSHPIIGDTTHGDGRQNRLFRDLGFSQLCLRAQKLSFTHPYTEQQIKVELEDDDYWKGIKALLQDKTFIVEG
ncbi:tRNA pseudouridine(65) synthase TruC [Alginatibacterium sediminis]|uniref:tRNA pseudouridine synthase C n=1 Tax=Alginatibacterium sediminis TaxID=2164068 RepID=A0A420E881_9ALTE|nr:pseudouridine synthase [Alginatibacterium sediminis]RKF15518.1 tRNA pseudouridine(65) synthase TruC [Alginatibacterium sediminis]